MTSPTKVFGPLVLPQIKGKGRKESFVVPSNSTPVKQLAITVVPGPHELLRRVLERLDETATCTV